MTTLRDDPIAQTMKKYGLEITRDNYIAFNWGNPTPDPWTAENEVELPDELQDFSRVKSDDREIVDRWSEDGILARYYEDDEA